MVQHPEAIKTQEPGPAWRGTKESCKPLGIFKLRILEVTVFIYIYKIL